MSWAALTTSASGVSGPAALTFEKETVSGRIRSSVIRGSILQFFVILVFSAVQSFAPWRPVGWFMFNLNVVFHPTSWFFDAMVVASVVAMGVIFGRGYRMTASAPTRGVTSLVRDLIRPEVAVSLVGHVVAGTVLARSYLGLVGHRQYSSLTLLCAELGQDRCINESHVFVVMSGGFSGLCLWLDYQLRNGAVLHFRAIQRLGMDHVRGELARLIREALSQVLLNLRWFYLVYIVFGGRFEKFLGDMLHMDLYDGQGGGGGATSGGLTVSETAWKHLGTFVQCLAVDTLIHLSVSLVHLVVNLSLTRRVKFAMRSVSYAAAGPAEVAASPAASETHSSVALLDAIDTNTNCHELMKYLAYQDFASMAEHSAMRRADFYILSNPGGHPRNWTELVTKVMSLIRDFANDLNEASKQAMTVNPSAADLAKAKAGGGSGSGGHPPPAKAIQSRLLDSKVMALAAANTNNNPPVLASSSGQPHGNKDNNKAGLMGGGGGWSALAASTSKMLADKLMSMLGRATLSSQWVGSSSSSSSAPPDVAVRAVYARAMPVIWAIKGMSHMVTNSISEDRYGVVQKDLAKIIVDFMTLLQTLERHKGLTATARKNRFETRDLQLKQDLRVTLKSSLYRITVAFGDSLNSLDLPAEHKHRLANFQLFKEG